MTKIAAPPFECNVCQLPRLKDNNHWLVLHSLRNGASLKIEKWNETSASQNGAAHACGQEHAMTLTARWMATGRFEEARGLSSAKMPTI